MRPLFPLIDSECLEPCRSVTPLLVQKVDDGWPVWGVAPGGEYEFSMDKGGEIDLAFGWDGFKPTGGSRSKGLLVQTRYQAPVETNGALGQERNV